MRVILFRGKAKHRKQWYKGFINYHKDRNEWYVLEDFGGFPCPIREETIGQFTGRKDKNDTEIFVGDILETDDYIGWVCYNEENTCFSLKYYDMHNEVYEVSLSGLENVEVIGNIHDNPELLRREK